MRLPTVSAAVNRKLAIIRNTYTVEIVLPLVRH